MLPSLLHNLILATELAKEGLTNARDGLQLLDGAEVPVELSLLVYQEGSLGPHGRQTLNTTFAMDINYQLNLPLGV